MNDEKIDLEEIVFYERRILRQIDDLARVGQLSPMHQEMRQDAQARLALVRAVRAAREYRVAVEWGFETRNVNAASVELGSALAPFTDSAEVPNG